MFRNPFGTKRNETKVANRRPTGLARGEYQVERLEQREVPASLQALPPNIDINRSFGSDAEVTIAINPTNPLNILAAGIDEASIFTDHQNLYRSIDGGTTWSLVTINLPTGFDTSAGDPGLVFDANGRALFTHMAQPTNNPAGLGMISAVSTDSGQTWTPGIITDGTAFDDKVFPAVGIDKTDPTRQIFYATWHRFNTILASSSLDGINWSPAVQVSQGNRNIDPHITVDTNGDVYDVWQDFGTVGQSQITLAKSTDGGVTWSPDQIIATTQVNPFIDPTSGGRYAIPAQPDRGMGIYMSIDTDRSGGPLNGRVYVAFVDQSDSDNNSATNHDDTDIYVIASADGGNTWTAANAQRTRVNDDFPGQNSQFFPWLSVDQVTGNVGVGWYDCRNDTGVPGPGDSNGVANDEAQYWAAISDDGGTTFSANIQLSDGTSNSHSFFDPTFFNFGDYTGTAFLNGTFYAIWADNSNSTGNNPQGTLRQMDMYVGRAQVAVTADVDSLSINPVFDVNPTGTFHTVTATVLDVQARPIRGVSVLFVVTGANGLLTATAFTDVNGVASITYVGNAAGFDNIAAFAGLATDSATKQWIAQTMLSGIVWIDNNNNAAVDPGELGIPGVTLTLTGTDINGNPVTATAITDASGAFIFSALFPSDANGFTITETQPAAYLDGFTRTTTRGIAGINVISQIVVAEGESVAGFFFAERGLLPTFITKRFFFSDAGTNVIPGSVVSPADTKTLAAFASAAPALPAVIQQGAPPPLPLNGPPGGGPPINLIKNIPKEYLPSTDPKFLAVTGPGIGAAEKQAFLAVLDPNKKSDKSDPAKTFVSTEKPLDDTANVAWADG